MQTVMKKTRMFRTLLIAAVILVVGAVAYQERKPKGPDLKGDLAQCLTDKGVKFYGAYWCPHCTSQKKLLGDGMKKVTYVECAVYGDPQAQTQACKDAGITNYPTWIFGDGTKVTGEQSLVELADKSGCPWTGR
ncbi:MAG: hypothetical protein AAB692_02230 [Patescibacteria group bacterium]